MKIAPLPPTKISPITEGMPPEIHISYQITIVANLMAFGGSTKNMQQFGINFREWRVFGTIGRMGPLTASDIVNLSHQDKATISRAITELSQKELVAKLPNRKHKRSPLIWFTEEGKALYDRIVPTFSLQAELFTEVLSKSEKKQLCELLDKLKDHIELVHEEQGLG